MSRRLALPLTINDILEPITENRCKKASYWISPLEEMFTRTIATSFALIMITEEPYVSVIFPGLAMFFIFAGNHSVYSETATLPRGVDIFTGTSKEQKAPPVTPSVAAYVKDIGMWLASVAKGICYGWSISIFCADAGLPRPLEILCGFYAGLFAHRAELLEMRLWSLRRETQGEPGYEKTVGKFLDFTNSYLPIPLINLCLPKVVNWISIDGAAAYSYTNYRAYIHMFAAQYVLNKICGLEWWTSFLIALLSPLGGAEHVYAASFPQRIMQHILVRSGHLPTEEQQEENKRATHCKPRLVKFIYELSNALYSLINGRATAAFWGIFFNPIKLYEYSKIFGSALIGPVAANEFKEQFPELTRILGNGFKDKATFDLEIPNQVYYPLALGLTLSLLHIGYMKVKAADTRVLEEEKMSFSQQILGEYGLDLDLEEPTNPPVASCTSEGISLRANGLCTVVSNKLRYLARFFCCRSTVEDFKEVSMETFDYTNM